MQIEIITDSNITIATIIRNIINDPPQSTTFVTSDDAQQQVGFIAYPKGGVVPNHIHLPLHRSLVGTTEVVTVVKGSCIVRLYTLQKEYIKEVKINHGDTILIGNCGHGFEMLEDTVLFEVKQGPYLGLQEKERF